MVEKSYSSMETGSVVRRFHCRGGMDSKVRKGMRKEWMIPLSGEELFKLFEICILWNLVVAVIGKERSWKRSRLYHTTRSIRVVTRAGRIVDKKWWASPEVRVQVDDAAIVNKDSEADAWAFNYVEEQFLCSKAGISTCTEHGWCYKKEGRKKLTVELSWLFTYFV